MVDVLTGQPNYPDGLVYPGYRPLGAGVEAGPAGERIQRVPLMPRGKGGALRLAGNYLSFTASARALGPWLLRGYVFSLPPRAVDGATPSLLPEWGVNFRL